MIFILIKWHPRLDNKIFLLIPEQHIMLHFTISFTTKINQKIKKKHLCPATCMFIILKQNYSVLGKLFDYLNIL